MSRKSILTALCLALTTAVMAQPKAGTFSIIPRLGVSLAKVSDGQLYVMNSDLSVVSSNYKPGLMAGADVEYQVTDFIAASVGAYYSRQGLKYDDYTESHDLSTKKWSEWRDVKEHHDYVNIPLMLSVYPVRNLALKAGVQLGINTNATMEYTEATITRDSNGEGSTESVDKTKTDLKLKKTDFSIPVGVSYEYMSVILEARYNIGLTNVYKDLGLDGKNRVFTFNIAYRFSL